MHRIVSAFFVAALFFQIPGLAQSAVPAGSSGGFGLGVMLGDPTGISGKYWLSSNSAIDGGLGWHFGGKDRLDIHSDYLWHMDIRGLGVPNSRLPFYFGGGLRVLAGDDSEAGIRIPLGLSWLPNQVPVELFAEIAPIVEFAPDTEADVAGAVGVRYYFTPR